MSQKDSPLDPIAFESARQEREAHVATLFHPILPAGFLPEMEWIVPGFIPRGYLVLLAADPKEGKTCLATALALAVATGTPFAGLATRQSAVLWLSMEESPNERNLILSESPLADPATPLYTCYDHLPIDADEGIDALDRWIDKTQAALIVVDPLHGAQSGRSLNDGWRARKTLKRLKKLCTERNVTALVLHHAKHSFDHRPAKVAENAQLTATASMDIVLSHRPLTPERELVARTPASELAVRPSESPTSQVDQKGPTGSKKTAKGNALDSETALSSPSPERAKLPIPESKIQNPKSKFESLRLLRLRTRGRGLFANQTLYFLSSGPLDYRNVQNPDALPAPEPRRSELETRLLAHLRFGSRTSAQLIADLNQNPGSLRNAITNLRREGLIRVVCQKRHERYYGLADKKVQGDE